MIFTWLHALTLVAHSYALLAAIYSQEPYLQQDAITILCLLTPNPIALVNWFRVTLSVVPCGSEKVSDRLITRSRTTPPDGLVAVTLTAGGWLQGRSVRFAAVTNPRTVESVTVQ